MNGFPTEWQAGDVMMKLRSGFLALCLLSPSALAECVDGLIFRGGASLDNGISQSAQVGAFEPIFIGGEICPLAEHIGQTAAIYIAFQIGDVIHLLNEQDELVLYDNTNLVPYRSAVTLSQNMPLALFNGVVGTALDQVRLYSGYSIDSQFVIDAEPVIFSVRSATSLAVQQFFPQRGTTTASTSTAIELRFNRPIDPASVDNTDLRVFGRWSGVRNGQLSLLDNNRSLRLALDQPLFNGEAVSLTLPGTAITALDGSPLEQGYSWAFSTEATPAALQFTETAVVSARVAGSTEQIQTYGAYAGDLNEDGWSDFVVPNEITNDLRIFLNDGAGGYGAFSIVPIDGGARPSPNDGGDFDGDGDIDFAVGSAGGDKVHIFLGDGKGGLVQTQNLTAGQRVRGVCLLDFENDGDPDIAATAFEGDLVALFRNEGNGNFVNAGFMQAGLGEWSCAAADMDADGKTDLIIGTRSSDELFVYTSDGDGTFTLASRQSANGDPWMLAAGDLNRDGNVDIAAANASAKSLTVAMGTGTGNLLAPVSYSLAENDDGFPLAVDMGDLDGDGDLDIVTADFRTRLFLIHENQGDGSFLRLSNQLLAPQAASCAILHDRDNDGDLDITGIDEVEDVLLLYSH